MKKKYDRCPECGGELLNKQGCQECQNCFWSACGRSGMWEEISALSKSLFTFPVMILMAASLLVFSLGCHPEYKDDVPVLSAVEAMVSELPILVKGKICRDSDGVTGGCMHRHPLNEDFNIALKDMPYDAEVEFDCSSNVQAVTEKYTIKAFNPWTLTVPRNNFGDSLTFVCTVKVLPLDRSFPAISTARVYVMLYNEGYKPLPSPTMGKDGFFFGENAKYVEFQKDGRKFYLKETTFTKEKGITQVFIESNSGRRVSWYAY